MKIQNQWLRIGKDALVILFITAMIFEITLRAMGLYYTVSEKTTNQYNNFYQAPGSSWYLIGPMPRSYTDRKSEFVYTYPKNSIGLFTKEVSPVKQPDEKRIFILGDSFTQGIGAPPDSSWPVLLENLLHSIPDSNYAVYNAGTGGSDPFFAYRFLADKLIGYHPDEVIFTVNGTDILDYVGRGGLERFQKDGTSHFRKPPWYSWLYQHSHVVRCIVTEVLKYDYTLMSPQRLSELKQQAITEIVNVIEQTKALCDRNGAKLLVVVHPGVADYSHPIPTPETFLIFDIVPFLQKNDIDVLDMRPGFAKVLTPENCNEYAWPVDGHFKSKGYELFAKIVYEEKFSGTKQASLPF